MEGTFEGGTLAGGLGGLAIPAEVASIFDSPEGYIIIDVGGDDVGATALGRFSRKINAIDYDMLYVVNRYRNLTATPEDAVEVLGEIKAVSGLTPTGLINNSHLMAETDAHIIGEGIEFAKKISSLTGLELKCNTIRRDLEEAGLTKEFPGEPFYQIDMYVTVNW